MVYALKIGEDWQKKEVSDAEKNRYGESYWEVRPTTKWNYGLHRLDLKKANELIRTNIDNEKIKSDYPWNLSNAPIELKVNAKIIPTWGLYNEMAGPIPHSWSGAGEGEPEEIILIPYGCTTLRISQFPLVY